LPTIQTANYDFAWKLRLFLSVDLIGSTAYKHQIGDADWCVTFLDFYRDYPYRVKQAYTKLPDWATSFLDTSETKIPVPRLWKLLGDEILFFVELSDYRETVAHLAAFRTVLADYNALLASRPLKPGVPKLACKGTAWIAGFPVNNFEARFSQSDSSTQGNSEAQTVQDTLEQIDFLGRSIDCGFRLGKFASRRKLVLSVDLVLMMAAAIERLPHDKHVECCDNLVLRFDDKHSLKGVLNNAPYPIFWIDADGTEENLEDKWLGRPTVPCEPKKVREYCGEYIQKTDGLIRPFIHKDGGECFAEIPKEIEHKRKLLVDRLTKPAEPEQEEETNTVDVLNELFKEAIQQMARKRSKHKESEDSSE